MQPDKLEEHVHRTAGTLFAQFLMKQVMANAVAATAGRRRRATGEKGPPVDLSMGTDYQAEMLNCAQIAIQVHTLTRDELAQFTKTGSFTKLPWHHQEDNHDP